MEQAHVIRHKHYVEGQSARRIAREMGLNRRTVQKYLGQSEPVRVEREARALPVMAAAGPRIEALLVSARALCREDGQAAVHIRPGTGGGSPWWSLRKAGT